MYKYIINNKEDVIFHQDEYRKLLKTVPNEERIKKEYEYYTKANDDRSLVKKNMPSSTMDRTSTPNHVSNDKYNIMNC